VVVRRHGAATWKPLDAGAAFMGEWSLDPATEADMRDKTHAFIERAAARLLANHAT
jgi:hypothetical protein